jgi:hypothetical protein
MNNKSTIAKWKKRTKEEWLEILRHTEIANKDAVADYFVKHCNVEHAKKAHRNQQKRAAWGLRDAIEHADRGSDVVVLDKDLAETILEFLESNIPKARGNSKIASTFSDLIDISSAKVTEPSKKAAHKMAQIWKVKERTAGKRIAAAFKMANK